MKFAIATGSRADFSYLKGVVRGLAAQRANQVQLVVTGAHLSVEHGETYKEILSEGFEISYRIPLPLSDDSASGVAEAMSRAISGFSKYFNAEMPDWLIVIGDRYEILAAVQVALLHKIPVAHLGGGDVTEGALDESIRHAISKMSHLHFVSNDLAGLRLVAMGESPEHVHVTGSTTIDALLQAPIISRDEFFRMIQFKTKKKNILVTFHPETLSSVSSDKQMAELLAALESVVLQAGILFTRPNADPGNQVINQMIDSFVAQNPDVRVVSSLGQNRYANALRHFDVVVGNSSSGIYEAPTFKKPTVNIGDRQKGRIQAASVIQAQCLKADISHAIQRAFDLDCTQVKNPYGDGTASAKIIEKILAIKEPKSLLKKNFFMKGTTS